MREFFAGIITDIRAFLAKLSFRMGMIILLLCIPFYVLSFAQMLLPLSPTAKSILWVLFFGLAKATQYAGLAIIGVDGWRRIKGWFINKQ